MTRFISAAILGVAISLTAVPVQGQIGETGVSGAGVGVFPSGTQFNGIAVSGLELGQGMFISSLGTAQGVFHTVLLGTSLLGQPQEITVDGIVNAGSIGPNGTAIFSGTATVDMGDGSLPIPSVPFTAQASDQAMDSLLLTLGGVPLPNAAIIEGGLTVQ